MNKRKFCRMKKEEKWIIEGIVEVLEKRENSVKQDSELNEWGIVCEVRDDVVYAKGLMKGGMSEMVEFEGLQLKRIINYLDKNKKVGMRACGSNFLGGLNYFFFKPFVGWLSNKWIFLQLVIKKKYSFSRYKWKS